MNVNGFLNENSNNDSVKCMKCGEENERESSFCWRCGEPMNPSSDTSIQKPQNTTPKNEHEVNCEPMHTEQLNNQQVISSPMSASYSLFGERKYSDKNGFSAKITTKDWLKVFCLDFLSLVPFVGTIALLIITIVFAVKDGVAESIQSYFRARLIFSLIITGIVLVACLVMLIVWSYVMNTVITMPSGGNAGYVTRII